MEDFAPRFRRALPRLREEGQVHLGGAPDFLEQAAAYVGELRRRGEPMRVIAEKLGVSVSTVYGWLRDRDRAAEPADGAATARPVEVVRVPGTRSCYVLHISSDIRVEGLEVEDIIAILTALRC